MNSQHNTEAVVREIRRKTRKKYSSEEQDPRDCKLSQMILFVYACVHKI